MWNFCQANPNSAFLFAMTAVGVISTVLVGLGYGPALAVLGWSIVLRWLPLFFVIPGLVRDEKRWLPIVAGASFYAWHYGMIYLIRHHTVITYPGSGSATG